MASSSSSRQNRGGDMAKHFAYREPNVEAYQVGSDMELPEWLVSVEQTWESPEHPEYGEYSVHFADGVRSLGHEGPLGSWGMIPGGFWIVKVDIGAGSWYGSVLTVMENEKLELLLDEVDW